MPMRCANNSAALLPNFTSNDELNGFAGLHMPRHSKWTWDPATDVDGVCTGQGPPDCTSRSKNASFTKRWAIVESPLDFELPIRANRGELLLLDVANASAGIQNNHVNPRTLQNP